MPLSTQNGFSEEEVSQCKGWLLPDVSGESAVSATVDKKKSLTKKNTLGEKNTEDKAEDIEIIEDVEIDTVEKLTPAISAEELEKITKEAEKEGYQIGFDKGIKEGKDEGLASGLADSKQTMVDQSQRLQHIIDALLTPIENEKKQIEQVLVDITCRLTESLLERELKTDPEIITRLIDSILTLLPQKMPSFTLYLNPDDMQLAESYLDEKLIVETADSDFQYKLEEDKTLMQGGCRLESTKTSIDASMETKLKKLLSDFVNRKHDKKEEESETIKESSNVTTHSDSKKTSKDIDENGE